MNLEKKNATHVAQISDLEKTIEIISKIQSDTPRRNQYRNSMSKSKSTGSLENLPGKIFLQDLEPSEPFANYMAQVLKNRQFLITDQIVDASLVLIFSSSSTQEPPSQNLQKNLD